MLLDLLYLTDRYSTTRICLDCLRLLSLCSIQELSSTQSAQNQPVKLKIWFGISVRVPSSWSIPQQAHEDDIKIHKGRDMSMFVHLSPTTSLIFLSQSSSSVLHTYGLYCWGPKDQQRPNWFSSQPVVLWTTGVSAWSKHRTPEEEAPICS